MRQHYLGSFFEAFSELWESTLTPIRCPVPTEIKDVSNLAFFYSKKLSIVYINFPG
jgi:hypothetical protein